MSTALVHLLSIYPVEPAPASLSAAASLTEAFWLFLSYWNFINLFSKQQQLTANLTVLKLSLRAFHATFTFVPSVAKKKKKVWGKSNPIFSLCFDSGLNARLE